MRAADGATSFAGFERGTKITLPTPLDGAPSVPLYSLLLLARFNANTPQPRPPGSFGATAVRMSRLIDRRGRAWPQPLGTFRGVPIDVLA
jgi:hypothetical protein